MTLNARFNLKCALRTARLTYRTYVVTFGAGEWDLILLCSVSLCVEGGPLCTAVRAFWLHFGAAVSSCDAACGKRQRCIDG